MVRFHPFLTRASQTTALIYFGIIQLAVLSQPVPAATVVEYQCNDEDIRWAGMSCFADDPCPVYLELTAVESVGNRIFLVGNIHSSSTTLDSIVLASEDAGKTWQEPHERIRGAGLDRIQFVDFENGWISGETQHPLPRDPFLLITRDGGKTWVQHPIFTDAPPGSIAQFWFTSRNDGGIVIDQGRRSESGRYQLYETANAGETWALRESSDRPLKPRHEGTANTDWQIRADASTKSFQIERRTGERWHRVAAFAVTIGSCKPSEPPPGETPPAAPAGDPPKPQPLGR
jgi:hypothetical protein